MKISIIKSKKGIISKIYKIKFKQNLGILNYSELQGNFLLFSKFEIHNPNLMNFDHRFDFPYFIILF